MTYLCADCSLPDPYHGDGDGIGSCECPRCETCGAAPMTCDCYLDEPRFDDSQPYDRSWGY